MRAVCVNADGASAGVKWLNASWLEPYRRYTPRWFTLHPPSAAGSWGCVSVMATLPSALAPELIDSLRGGTRSLVFFLDYDGTLAPIVDEPERAFISDQTRETIRRLATVHPVGLVSGRSVDKLRAFLQLDGLYLAGSHGVDVVGPSGHAIEGPDPAVLVGEPALAALKTAMSSLNVALGDVPGYLTEDNVYCISAHYRMVAPAEHVRVRDVVHHVLGEHPCLKHKEGKMVHELRPAIDWDKGRAVEWLLDLLERGAAAPQSSAAATANAADAADAAGATAAPSAEGGWRLLPVYIGDDVADEDAFRAVARRDGIGIKVAEGPVASEATAATRSLTQPQVVQFLAAMAADR